ncbi:histidine phosphatase family protein [Paenibacillus sp. Marseille-P2973]|uniref:histidine phosphatase family protein n=1 Tax=Paenibacillus sp. Marseille-P2973 TaxID=1871032 RepID=UPI001FFCB4C5|nr:histidine phosphatase family protein [Paenibacillus sp. Marseille-P2973]
MLKSIYLVRHCQASGQDPQAQLTDEGVHQAGQLAEFFKHKPIEYIVSSPFVRAINTIQPLSELIQVEIHRDERLQERILSATPLANWMEKLEETFYDFELKFDGGESSNEALGRGLEVIAELLDRPEKTFLIVTHGALLSLIIKQYNKDFGFEDWRRLSNPDVYRLEIQDHITEINRVWPDHI